MTELEKKQGIFKRKTKQRETILEVLRSLKTHPTASELYEKIRETLPKISLGTVYRNLESLFQAGMIHKIDSGSGEARYDGDLEHHFHIRCVSCKRVDDVWDAPGNTIENNVQELSGYQVIGFRFEFVGVCPSCRGDSN